MAERWTNLDYERARKYLFKEATTGETTAIRTAMNTVQSQAPNSVAMGKYYLERLDAISLTLDQLSTKYAGVKTRPDGEGILEYWQGEPYETLRASGRGFVKALEKLTGLVAEGDFFQSPEARGFEMSQVEGLTDALADKADLVDGVVPLAQLPPASDAGHALRTDNPHTVTAAQVGAVATADFEAHTGDTDNPHTVTAAQVGAVATALLGVADGVATLGNDGKVPSGQLPAMGGGISRGVEAARNGQLWFSNNTVNNLIYNLEKWDPDTAYNTTTGTYTVPATGTYLIFANCAFTVNIPDEAYLDVLINGGGNVTLDHRKTTGNAWIMNVGGHTVIDLTAGQAVTFGLFTKTPGGGAATQNAGMSTMAIYKLH